MMDWFYIAEQIMSKHNIVINKYGVMFNRETKEYFSIEQMEKECLRIGGSSFKSSLRKEVYLYIRVNADITDLYNGLYVTKGMLTKGRFNNGSRKEL